METRWAKHRYLDASALVKLVVDEGDHEPVRSFFKANVNFGATSLCVAEALGAIKAKWSHGRLSEAAYFHATRELVLNTWSNRVEVEDVGLFSPDALQPVEAMARKHNLDLSDALQLETIRRGKYAHLGPNSASVLITADSRLARAAELEGMRAWNCIAAPLPVWA